MCGEECIFFGKKKLLRHLCEALEGIEEKYVAFEGKGRFVMGSREYGT